MNGSLEVERSPPYLTSMPNPVPEWQHLAVYAVAAAVIIMVLQRIPVIGLLVRLAFTLGLLAFLIFVVLQQAPYRPELARFTQALGLDDQKVTGKELRVRMSPDGHFWAFASINGVQRRMLIDSGATVTAVSEQTHEKRRSVSAPASRQSCCGRPTERLRPEPDRSTSCGSAISLRATSRS
jgi:hypothetical protein